MISKGYRINDRYEIIKSIGEGGMANVYLAHDTILDREVAVKVLRGDLADDEKFVRRFQREAISASSLTHPNIVEMYDVGESDGKYFIVMEYIEGVTLKSLTKRRGALILPEVIDIMTQITSGLSCAHDSYIIHRDIKPQNILILDDGRVKITDFGIAVATNSSDLTQTNSVMGSVHYIPPEQANGDSPDVKSDIYSVGILMYELITGKVPFRGDNAVEIAIKQMKEPIPSIVEINPDIPQSVENIILKACAKNPKNRYENVNEMYRDLKTCLDEDKRDVRVLSYEYEEFEEEKLDRKKIKNNETDKMEEFEDKKSDKKTGRLIIALSFITVIIACILIFVLMFYPKIRDKNSEIAVPNVVGMKQADAESKLEELGFIVLDDVKEEASDTIEAGKVISTTPSEGRTIKTGSNITLIVSTGSDMVVVEDYVGENIELVQMTLESKNINVFIEEEEHSETDELEDGEILSQNIEVGTKIEKNDTISFTVVKIIAVYPNFVEEAYTLDQVKDFSEDHELDLIITEKETNEAEEGTIIYQSRTADSKVVDGVTLRITVAKPFESSQNQEVEPEQTGSNTETQTGNEEETSV